MVAKAAPQRRDDTSKDEIERLKRHYVLWRRLADRFGRECCWNVKEGNHQDARGYATRYFEAADKSFDALVKLDDAMGDPEGD